MNNYSVTIADTSSHSVAQSGIAATSKIAAVLSVMQDLQDQSNTLASLVVTETWTITVTQP